MTMVFKVMRFEGDHMRSAGLMDDEPLCATYRPGEWTEADPRAVAMGYGLIAFARLDQAADYLGLEACSDLWECEVRGGVWRPGGRVLVCQVSLDSLWEQARATGPTPDSMDPSYWADGLVMVRAVRPARRLATRRFGPVKWEVDRAAG